MRKALAPILILAILGTLGVFQRELLGDIFVRLVELPRIRLVPLMLVATAQAALAAGYGIVFGCRTLHGIGSIGFATQSSRSISKSAISRRTHAAVGFFY